MTCACLFSLALQDHTRKYSAFCQLLILKNQHVGRTINHKGSAKVINLCAILAEEKRLEAGTRSKRHGMPPIMAMLFWAASPSDTGTVTGIGLYRNKIVMLQIGLI